MGRQATRRLGRGPHATPRGVTGHDAGSIASIAGAQPAASYLPRMIARLCEAPACSRGNASAVRVVSAPLLAAIARRRRAHRSSPG
ncbi:MAG: hypothetical protein D6693_08055 [Planctomycetota bacterium]|nr:MAG: hypothetical protein D6693_08055 [Planctomycetota bacterium]